MKYYVCSYAASKKSDVGWKKSFQRDELALLSLLLLLWQHHILTFHLHVIYLLYLMVSLKLLMLDVLSESRQVQNFNGDRDILKFS